tara:strand:- start:227 stop:334 length:108 start_codon:yes stop_codon:yes gene_type:complete
LAFYSQWTDKKVFGVPVVAILIGVVVLFVAKRGSK